MPKVHSKFNDKDLENILIEKSMGYLSEKGTAPSFIFLSGQFFDVKNTNSKIVFA